MKKHIPNLVTLGKILCLQSLVLKLNSQQATYAMEVYQFYHEEEKNDGEFILLSGLETVNGIKLPKERAWYYNKESKYLGTDFLITRQRYD